MHGRVGGGAPSLCNKRQARGGRHWAGVWHAVGGKLAHASMATAAACQHPSKLAAGSQNCACLLTAWPCHASPAAAAALAAQRWLKRRRRRAAASAARASRAAVCTFNEQRHKARLGGCWHATSAASMAWMRFPPHAAACSHMPRAAAQRRPPRARRLLPRLAASVGAPPHIFQPFTLNTLVVSSMGASAHCGLSPLVLACLRHSSGCAPACLRRSKSRCAQPHI